MDPAQFFIGFFAAIGLFNALLFLVIRDRPFAWYAAAMGSMIALQLVFPPFVTPLRDVFGTGGFHIYRIVALCAYYICLIGFTRSFLEVGRRFRGLDRVLITLLAINVLGIVFETTLPETWWHDAIDDVFNFALLGACVYAGIRTARAGESSAKYFITAFAGAVLGIAINDLNARFLGPHWVDFALQAGVAWEALFLALALADRLQFAVVDQLTGIPNRRALDLALERAFEYARRAHAPLAILMIDIDDFKKYNDAFGHPAGDALLRDVARAARGVCRAGVDTFARYGGEEFIAILPGGDVRTAGAIAERMRADVERLTVATVSIGYALSTPHDGSGARAVARADAALYVAKGEGKNRTAADPATCDTIPAV